MISTVAPRSKEEIDLEIRLMRQSAKEIMKSKASARTFLIKNGFITKAGKLTKRYGG